MLQEVCTVGKCWHHVFIKVIMVIHKYYTILIVMVQVWSIIIESEGTHAVGKCLLCLHKDIAIKRNCQIL